MPDLSVVICTHNPRPAYFARTLEALKGQTLPLERWELIVIDNASALGREPAEAISWHPAARMLREEKLGLTPARLRGIEEATCELIVFVDDDNVLATDYLEGSFRVANEKPFLGSWSGQCAPDFEEPPAEWTRRYWGNLVIREFDRDSWSNLPRLAATMPCGAGLCVRRSVARRYLELHRSGTRSFQFDRIGTSLLSGGDNDLAATACSMGLGVGLISTLRLTHLIPADRLTLDYLERLAEGIQFSSTLLDHEYGIETPRRGVLRRIADLLRVMRLTVPHRRIARAVHRGRDRALGKLSSREER